MICDIYYNFEQNECIEILPDGYFVNDSSLKTIDKCDPQCKTCDKKIYFYPYNPNCKSCYEGKYLNLGYCQSTCLYGFFIDTFNNKICKCEYDIKCLECTVESISNSLCISCNNENGYFPKYENNSNINNYINCYKEPEGYFLKKETYYQCFKTCKNCIDFGDINNNKCTDCYSNNVLINESNRQNCYEKCNYYYYFDKDNKYYCTKDEKCPDKYNKLIPNKNKCIDNCTNDDIYKYEFNNICILSCPKGAFISPNNSFLCEDITIINKESTLLENSSNYYNWK